MCHRPTPLEIAGDAATISSSPRPPVQARPVKRARKLCGVEFAQRFARQGPRGLTPPITPNSTSRLERQLPAGIAPARGVET